MQHEAELLEKVTRLRTQAAAGGREQQIETEAGLAGSVGDLLARIEAYPELKADSATERLARELRAIEEKIVHGRTVYDEAVMEYNDTVSTFPACLLARPLGFKAGLFFSGRS